VNLIVNATERDLGSFSKW